MGKPFASFCCVSFLQSIETLLFFRLLFPLFICSKSLIQIVKLLFLLLKFPSRTINLFKFGGNLKAKKSKIKNYENFWENSTKNIILLLLEISEKISFPIYLNRLINCNEEQLLNILPKILAFVVLKFDKSNDFNG